MLNIRLRAPETLEFSVIDASGNRVDFPAPDKKAPNLTSVSRTVLSSSSVRIDFTSDKAGSFTITGSEITGKSGTTGSTSSGANSAVITGLATGTYSDVVLSVEDSSKNRANANVPEFSLSSSNLKVTVTPTRTSGVAPLGVGFEATVSGFTVSGTSLSGSLAARHLLSYTWETNTGDPTPDYRAFAGIEERRARLGGLDPKTGVGQKWGRIFWASESDWASHGSNSWDVQVRCIVRSMHGEEAASDWCTVTMHDPDSYFTTAQTFVLSTKGNFSGAPAGTQITTADLKSVLQKQASGLSKVRLRLKAGETGYLGFEGEAASGATLIDRWGAGNDPQISTVARGAFYNTTCNEVAFSHITLKGDIDPDSLEGSDVYPISTGSGGYHLTMYRTDMLNTARPLGFGSGKATTFPILGDSRIEGWRDYGIFWLRAQGIFCGVKIHAPRMGVQYNAGSGHGSGGGTPCRLAYGTGDANLWGAVLSDCDFYTHISQAGNTMQPALRGNTSGIRDAKTTISRCFFEGGSTILAMVGGSSGSSHVRQDCVIDTVILATGHSPVPAVAVGHTGTTLKNFIYLGARTSGSGYFHTSNDGVVQVRDVDSGTGTPDNNGHVHIYNGSVIAFWNASENRGSAPYALENEGAPSDFVYSNVEIYAPLDDKPKGTAGHWDLSEKIGVPNHVQTWRKYDDVEQSGDPRDDFMIPETFTAGNFTRQANFCFPAPRSSMPSVSGRYAGSDFLGRARNASSRSGAVDPLS